jgi:hypothetical protein
MADVQSAVTRPADAAADGPGARSRLLPDRFLPHDDLAVVPARVFRAPPDASYEMVRSLDFCWAPLIRTLIDLRGLPPRFASAPRGRGQSARSGRTRRTLRPDDLTVLELIVLGETPGAEMVLRQVSQPWRPAPTFVGAPVTPDQFAGFASQGSPGLGHDDT